MDGKAEALMPELTGYRADSTDQAELEKLVEVLSDS